MSFHVDLPESRNDAEHEDALSPVERTFLDTHAKGCWNVLPCGVPDPMADCNSGVRFTHWTVQFELSQKQAKCAAKGRPFYIEKQSGEREGFATIHEFLRAGWVATDASMTR